MGTESRVSRRMKLKPVRLVEIVTRRPCEQPVAYLPSARPCRKLAMYRVGSKCVCGTHANALVFRAVMAGTR